jgi:hypothetical protein
VTVTNSTSDTCTSDIMATLSDGRQLLFSSLTGYGGERGSWGPLPTNVVDGVGIINYPPGKRTWPVTLPDMTSGTYSLTLPIMCATETTSLVPSFSVSDR